MTISLNTVFYNPSINDINCFLSLSKNFDCAQCYINSKLDDNVYNILKKNSINILGNQKNVGLSKAYNELFKNLKKDKIEFCFLVDQDSRFESEYVKEFILKSLISFKKIYKVGIISMFPKNGLKDIHIEQIYKRSKYKLEVMDYVINSGSLIKIKAWHEVGGYDEKLFIDRVDFDFCRTLRKKNWLILKSKKHIFCHTFGREKKSFLGFVKHKSYDEFRYFHFMKSRIYVFQKSKADNNPIKNFFNLIILFLQIIKQFILIFLLENKKFKKLKSSINAIILSTNFK